MAKKPLPGNIPQEELEIRAYQKNLLELNDIDSEINKLRTKNATDESKSRIEELKKKKTLIEEERKLKEKSLGNDTYFVEALKKTAKIIEGSQKELVILQDKLYSELDKKERERIKSEIEEKKKSIDAQQKMLKNAGRGVGKFDDLTSSLKEFDAFSSILKPIESIKESFGKVSRLGKAVGGIFSSKDKSSDITRKAVGGISSDEDDEDSYNYGPQPANKLATSVTPMDGIISNGESSLTDITKYAKLIYEEVSGKFGEDEKNRKLDYARQTEFIEELLESKQGGGEIFSVDDAIDAEKESFLSKTLPEFFGGLANRLISKEFITKIGTTILGMLGSVFKFIFSPLGALAAGLTWAITDGVKGIFKFGGISGFIGGLFGGLDSGVKGMFSGAGKWALIGAGIGSFIPGIGTLIGGAIGALFGGIMGFFGGEKISKAIKGYWKFLGDIFGKMFDNIKRIGKFLWDYSPLGILFNTISKVINYFKQQEGDSIFDKLKAGMSNIKKGFGRWLLGIIPDVFGLGWLRSSIAKVFGVDAKGNSTDKKNGNTTSSVSVDKDEKTGEPKEISSREKTKIGLASKQVGLASEQLSWLSKIGTGISDLIGATKEKVIKAAKGVAKAGSYVGDTAKDVVQDAWKGVEAFKDRVLPSKSQKEQQGLIISELKKSGITDPKAIANILAINKAESRFKPQSENMKYSAKRLMEIFPNRFKDYESAQKVAAGGEKAIAEHLYGAQSKKGKELGNTELGDGWKYRGRGLNQLTGKANYAKYGKMIGVDLVKDPDLANDPVIAAKLNAAYYKDRAKGDLSKLNSGDEVMKMTGHTNAEMKAERRSYMAQNYASDEFKSGYAGTPSVDSTTKAVEAKERNVANNTARATRSSTAAIVNAPSVTNNTSSNTNVIAGRPAYRNNIDDQRLQLANGDMASVMS